ncbi:DUF6236 family protein [Bacillus mycoides]|uniref:DUF6236 family protein n=1 Tax=Bacillus mycoides TaxID=1405 RepID=UPI001C00A22A|nr:DUF6236 family protein [Bacillus mycoides]QWI48259.1 hypothetical protein EXW56_04655 [Bacillus mycoides]
MSFRYLYYPTMTFPNNDWLKRVLLYSDGVASIVPYELQNMIGYDFELLQDLGEFSMLSPEPYLWNKEFENEVIEHFNSKEYQDIVAKLKGNQYFDIHQSKLSYAMTDLLQRHQMFVEDGDWYKVPKKVADSYMGILAKHMGRYHDYIPTTDKMVHENLIYATRDRHAGRIAGKISLLNCLPVPSRQTPFEDIIAFKRERREELLTFRQMLLKNVQDLSKCDDEDEFRLLVTVFQEEMEQETLKIQRLLKEKRINFMLEGFKSLLEVRNPLMWAAAYTLLTNNNMSQSSSILAAGGLMVGYQYIKARSEVRSDLINSPYAYIFHAQTRFGAPSYNSRSISLNQK